MHKKEEMKQVIYRNGSGFVKFIMPKKYKTPNRAGRGGEEKLQREKYPQLWKKKSCDLKGIFFFFFFPESLFFMVLGYNSLLH